MLNKTGKDGAQEDLCNDESLFQLKAAVDIGCDPKTLDARCNAFIDVIRFQIRAGVFSPLLL